MEKIEIRGIAFANVTPEEAVQIVESYLQENGLPRMVFTPNAEIAQLVAEQPPMAQLFAQGDLILPDGAGVVLASKILRTPLKGRVTGFDLGENIVERSHEKGYRLFFLGGKPEVPALATQKLKEKYPNAMICGTHDGYFEKEGAENDAVIATINAAAPEILYVCFGAPKQEQWILANRSKFTTVRVCLGLGGSLDGYAGISPRAPQWMIRLNLEWFYRLCKQPSRLGRMMKLPKYIIGTYFYKWKNGKNKEK